MPTKVLRQIRFGESAANCGFVQGLEPPGSVIHFVQRSITLIGIDPRCLFLERLGDLRWMFPLVNGTDYGERREIQAHAAMGLLSGASRQLRQRTVLESCGPATRRTAVTGRRSRPFEGQVRRSEPR